MLLDVRDLDVYYGAIHALQGISFHMEPGEIVTLIGANGAGKSTTLRTISGLIRPRRGTVTFKSQEISRTAAERIVRLGINHVPEGRKIFAPLTVLENLEMGAYTRDDPAEIRQSMERVFQTFPRLKERLTQLGGTLSGGEQQMLAIGRAMMAKPSLLLLDEPSMGLAPVVVEKIAEIIQEINATGTSILLVEQNAHMALTIAHRGYVMETGRIVLEGSADKLLHDPQVRQAYLGG
ncbi:ABC transporter ATP-binding protein [Candidatus Amarolinea aalborgensis]|jgi:branched-chain amino acid transport system ATP-binding protein|uniref:ABC transporter ATP-binding protein n=1 Tax=Candidatus Amarolinea aalborgensis TaxID=2249329 RepID=UPI003BF98FD0